MVGAAVSPRHFAMCLGGAIESSERSQLRPPGEGEAMSSHKRLIRRGFMLAVAAGIVAVAAVGSSAQAGRVMAAGRGPAALGTCTINWTGTAGDHQWTTTTNWNPVRVPTTSDYACVPSTYTQTVILSAGTNVVNGVNLQGSG